MEEIDDFFDFSKKFERVIVPAGYVNGRQIKQENDVTGIKKRKMPTEDYPKLHVDAENLQILENMGAAGLSRTSSINTLNQLEDFEMDMEDDVDPKSNANDEIYKKYNFGSRPHNLPICDSKDLILKKVRENRVVILEGDTGCGKTTQVPQYILEDAFRRREYCNVVCTQPRRIAAISLANRVCFERKLPIGTLVGYQVGLHATSSEDTRLLYCTTGVLLQKLIGLKNLNIYTHIILDEVHERALDMDFLLIIIKKFLRFNSSKCKIILMSATINTNEFSEYFKIPYGGTLQPAPTIKVDTRRLYDVRDFYLCQLDKLGMNPDINYDEPGITDEMYKVALKLVIICEKLDSQDEELSETVQRSSILIFLPGINEIDKMEKTFEALHRFKTNLNLVPMRLHSKISAEEQQRVFKKLDRNLRKVILATNIAESSITVPDVKYVIDFCLTKSIISESNTNLTSLQISWASRANCKQRAGRAGRCSNGRVYRLVSKKFYDENLSEYESPEMTRCPLENVILKAKLLNMGQPHEILALAMAPPNLSDIRNTILVLKETGALYQNVNGQYDILDGDLTFIGRVMAALPIDVRMTRLIIFGYIFSVLEETIIMAAGLNVRNIFEFPYNNKLGAYSQKVTWSDGSGSDLFAIWKAYGVWCNMKERRNFSTYEIEKLWARRYFINTQNLRELHLLVAEIKCRLEKVGIHEEYGVNRINWTNEEETIILKLVIAGAFYPHYFLRSGYDHHAVEKDIYHGLRGFDPCNTVYFTGFDTNYIGQLYVEQIKNLFIECADIQAKNIEINFGYCCQRVFITFLDDSTIEGGDRRNKNNLILSLPGRVKIDVYKAIKMRILKCPTTIKVMQPRDAIIFAEKEKLGVAKFSKWIPRKQQINNPELVVLPSLYTKFVRGKVTHIENCSKFWFQPLSEVECLREITQNLNSYDSDIRSFSSLSEISNGQMVAAPLSEIRNESLYHRARVIKIFELKNIVHCRVFFIDYGNYSDIPFKSLRNFGDLTKSLNYLPPRIFQCSLAEIQPSSIISPSGEWCPNSMELMQSFIEQEIVEAEIYALVHNICSVILRVNNVNFNQLLIQKGFAQLSEENYLAKIDHDNRLRKQQSRAFPNEDMLTDDDILQCVYGENDTFTKPAPIEKCKIRVDLKGPFSPLESKIYAATRVGEWKAVKMDPSSVNSVLLDTDPQACHDRLIVAASMCENSSSNTIIARETTLMPNIPGFSALMGLIFCPKMELKRDVHKTKYTSFVAGLGFDKDNDPIFEEHDIVFKLDVTITPDDLQKINQIRYSMDSLLNTDLGVDRPQVSRKDKALLTGKIKYLIIELLKKPREYIEVQTDMSDNVWNQMDSNDLLVSNSIYGDRSIFPLHTGLRLYNESFERIETLKKHCKELHDMGKFDSSNKFVFCELCQMNLEGIIQLRIHLFSQIHRDRESQICYKDEEEAQDDVDDNFMDQN